MAQRFSAIARDRCIGSQSCIFPCARQAAYDRGSSLPSDVSVRIRPPQVFSSHAICFFSRGLYRRQTASMKRSPQLNSSLTKRNFASSVRACSIARIKSNDVRDLVHWRSQSQGTFWRPSHPAYGLLPCTSSASLFLSVASRRSAYVANANRLSLNSMRQALAVSRS